MSEVRREYAVYRRPKIKSEMTLSEVIDEAKQSLHLVQGCLECNAEDVRRWKETIQWLENLREKV